MTDELKKLALKYGTSEPARRRDEITDDDRLLLCAYESRRRRIDPLYEARGTKVTAAVRALRRELEVRGVHGRLRLKYLDFLFERWSCMTERRDGGRCDYPPVTVLASDHFLSQFTAALGGRFDVDRAARMLRAAGFGDSHPSIVLALAVSVAKGADLESAETSDRMRAAVAWLVPRLARVGLADGATP